MSESAWDFAESDFRDLELHREMCLGVADPDPVSDWPVHQPECYDAPIPGRVWYGGCTSDRPRVNPHTGRCLECDGEACRECGRENCPEHK